MQAPFLSKPTTSLVDELNGNFSSSQTDFRRSGGTFLLFEKEDFFRFLLVYNILRNSFEFQIPN